MRLSERPLDFDFILKQLQRAPDALMPYRKEVVALLLFGSASRDEITPLSDIDLAVLYREGLSEWEMFKIHSNLYLDLSRLMHTDDFDLVNLSVAPLTLQFSAIEDKVILVLYDPQALVDFQAKVLGAYLDFYPILREYYKRLIGTSEELSMDIKLMNQIELLQEYISRLERIRQKPIEEYLKDETLQAATERYLQIAIETCINIGNRLLSLHQFKGNFKAPKTYADIFKTLASLNVIPKDFADKLARMCAMRNILVHVYWEVDSKLVYRTIHYELDDFGKFLSYVMAFLNKLEEQKG